jgi:precorrin-6B methylase 2
MLGYLKHYWQEIERSKRGSYNLLSLLRNYNRWERTVKSGMSPLQAGTPWMTFEAIDFLNKNIHKDMVVFEYGSGGSSIYFSKHAKQVYSVEHDKEWFVLVQKTIADLGITNWEGTFIEPEINTEIEQIPDSVDYSTSDPKFGRHIFKAYVKAIDKFPSQYFDLIVVDGRARPACIRHSIDKLKPNGYMLLDNAERETYQDAINKYMSKNFVIEIDAYGATSHNMYFTKTAIWKKVN